MADSEQTTPSEADEEKPRKSAKASVQATSDQFPTVDMYRRDPELRTGESGFVVRAALSDLPGSKRLSVEEVQNKVRGFLSRKVKVEESGS